MKKGMKTNVLENNDNTFSNCVNNNLYLLISLYHMLWFSNSIFGKNRNMFCSFINDLWVFNVYPAIPYCRLPLISLTTIISSNNLSRSIGLLIPIFSFSLFSTWYVIKCVNISSFEKENKPGCYLTNITCRCLQ